MKIKKILGGFVVVAVLLSGTTFLYFGGADRGGVAPALAACSSVGCGPGECCYRFIDMEPGCTQVPCCPQEQTYCDTFSRSPAASYPKLRLSFPGKCYSFEEEVTVCNYFECQNNSNPPVLCSDPACGPQSETPAFDTKRAKAIAHGACLVQQ